MATPWEESTLLSFDGGGVRGFASLLLLEALMREIARVEQDELLLSSILSDVPGADTTSAPSSFHPFEMSLSSKESERLPYLPCHYFDYVAGSGTGGLIAIMLARLRMTPHNALEEYIGISNRVYGRPRTFHCRRFPPLWSPERKYSTYGLERAIRDLTSVYNRGAYAGNSDVVPLTSDLDICRTIVVARGGFGSSSDKRYILRSYSHYPNKETATAPLNAGPSCGASLWEVGRATMAAPTYFEKQELGSWSFKYGGMRASNPTEDAVHELQLLVPMQPPTVVVSIGTGARHHTSMGNGGVANILAPLRGLLASIGDTDKVNRKVKKQLGHGSSYYRINDRSGDWNRVIMDQWIPRFESERKQSPGHQTMERMQSIVEKYLKDGGQEEMERCAEKLVKLRRRRLLADPDRWERFALVSVFHCPNCPNIDTFTSRAGFERHIENNHEKAELDIDRYKNIWSYQGQKRSSWYIP